MAEQIEEKLGLPSQLVKGHGGVFEVSFDGQPLFSKKGLGRFPEPGEVEAAIEQRLGA